MGETGGVECTTVKLPTPAGRKTLNLICGTDSGAAWNFHDVITPGAPTANVVPTGSGVCT